MTKRPGRAAPGKTRRNPLAREVRSPKFRPRVVPRVDVYKRRPKHPPKPDELP